MTRVKKWHDTCLLKNIVPQLGRPATSSVPWLFSMLHWHWGLGLNTQLFIEQCDTNFPKLNKESSGTLLHSHLIWFDECIIVLYVFCTPWHVVCVTESSLRPSIILVESTKSCPRPESIETETETRPRLWPWLYFFFYVTFVFWSWHDVLTVILLTLGSDQPDRMQRRPDSHWVLISGSLCTTWRLNLDNVSK